MLHNLIKMMIIIITNDNNVHDDDDHDDNDYNDNKE